METPKHWCSMHGDWHEDKQYAERFGQCRPCWNQYQSWRTQQVKAGKPAGVQDYREAHNFVKHPRPGAEEALTECSVCLKRPRDRGSFCRGCHNAYTAWSTKRRAFAKVNNRTITCTIEEFQLAIDQGWVVPRYEGEPHLGRVVRQV